MGPKSHYHLHIMILGNRLNRNWKPFLFHVKENSTTVLVLSLSTFLLRACGLFKSGMVPFDQNALPSLLLLLQTLSICKGQFHSHTCHESCFPSSGPQTPTSFSALIANNKGSHNCHTHLLTLFCHTHLLMAMDLLLFPGFYRIKLPKLHPQPRALPQIHIPNHLLHISRGISNVRTLKLTWSSSKSAPTQHLHLSKWQSHCFHLSDSNTWNCLWRCFLICAPLPALQ